jgi:hypothetical protein
MNQQLVSYIRQQLRANEQRESIMNTLLAQGWKSSDLDAAFAVVEKEQTVAPAPPAAAPEPASFAQAFPGATEIIESKPKLFEAQVQAEPQKQVQSSVPVQSRLQPQVQPQTQVQAQTPTRQLDTQAGVSGGFPGDEQFNESAAGQPSLLKSILAFVGLGFGVLSLGSFFMPWVGLPLAVIGVILCIVGVLGPKKLFAFIGLGLCVIGLVGFGVKIVMSRPAPVSDNGNTVTQPTTTNPGNTVTTNPGNTITTTTTTNPGNTVTQQPATTPVSKSPLLSTTPYIDANGGYAIQPPKGWQVGQGSNNGRNFIIFLSPTQEKNNKGQVVFNENINITSEPNKEATSDAYVQKSRQALQQYLTGYKITDEKDVTVNGQPAKIIGGTFTQNGLQLRSLQLFAFKGTTAYVVTGLALVTKWVNDSPAIQASLTSFVFQ